MFRKLAKNKKAQNTAEYAILISLVVAGIIAMQTYAQRALRSQYTVNRQEDEGQVLGRDITSHFVNSATTRELGGFQDQVFCKTTDQFNDK